MAKEPERAKLLECLPIDGTALTEPAHRKAAGIPKGLFDRAYDALLAEGLIIRAMGPGKRRRLNLVNPKIVDMIKKKIDAAARKIAKHIPKDGRAITNKALREKTGFTGREEKLYWAGRDKLKKEGRISLGGGMGGSVSWIEEALGKKKLKGYIAEKDLYAGIKQVLSGSWADSNGIRNPVVEITAANRPGGKNGGGKWTVPDLVVVSVDRFTYIPNKILTLSSFEVKAAGRWDIMSVFEAAAHKAFAHRSYLLIHEPDLDKVKDRPTFERVKRQAARLGIGLVGFQSPQDYDTYDNFLEPVHDNPDSRDVDDFIETHIKRPNKEMLEDLL